MVLLPLGRRRVGVDLIINKSLCVSLLRREKILKTAPKGE